MGASVALCVWVCLSFVFLTLAVYLTGAVDWPCVNGRRLQDERGAKVLDQ